MICIVCMQIGIEVENDRAAGTRELVACMYLKLLRLAAGTRELSACYIREHTLTDYKVVIFTIAQLAAGTRELSPCYIGVSPGLD